MIRSERRRRRLRRGAYLLPSLLTMGNMILGCYSAVRAFRGDFASAGLLLMAAAILDGLDGYIARLTHTESDFGRQFDSLADVITFGAAPAFLTFVWCQPTHGRIAWLVPVFFLVCTATRLARFNVQATKVDSRYFVGLPTPAAAGSIAAIAVFSGGSGSPTVTIVLLAANLILGSLMVSTFRYPSLKNADLRRRWSYRMALPLVAFLLLLIYRPPVSLLAMAAFYTAAGPVGWLIGRARRRGATGDLESATDPAEGP